MSLLEPKALILWTDFFRANTLYVGRCGINYLKELLKVPIYSSFLWQVQQRWDPHTHTFRFGNREMCPTVEEFRAILGTSGKQVLQLEFQNSMNNYLTKELGISGNASQKVVKSRKFYPSKLSELVLVKGGIPEDQKSYHVSIIMMLAHFLLCPLEGAPSEKVIEVASKLFQGDKDPTALILAETIIGLDRASQLGKVIHQGSPLLLQIWLMDRLQILPPPPRSQNLTLFLQMQRIEKVMMTQVDAVISDDTPIRWTMPWYKIKEMIYSMSGKPVVHLLGIEETSFYIPGRLFLQFGLTPVPLLPPGLIIEKQPFKLRMHREYQQKWKEARKLPVINEDDDDADDGADEEYQKYLKKDEKKRMRKIEKVKVAQKKKKYYEEVLSAIPPHRREGHPYLKKASSSIGPLKP